MTIKSGDFNSAVRKVRDSVIGTKKWAYFPFDGNQTDAKEVTVRRDVFDAIIEICFAADRLSFAENSGGLTSYSKTLDNCLDALSALRKIVEPIKDEPTDADFLQNV